MKKSWVPYVWGGSQIASRKSCAACRACLVKKPRLAPERRLQACKSCERCGIDCSHFVNQVYEDAGLS